MLALLYATTYSERVNKIFLTAAIGVTAEGLITFGEELEKRLSEKDKTKLSKLEDGVKRGESSIEEVLSILARYYVYSEESLNQKTKTSIDPKIGRASCRDKG